MAALLLAAAMVVPGGFGPEPLPVLRQGAPNLVVDYEVGLFSQFGKAPTDGQIWYHETVTGLLSSYEDYDGFIAVVDCSLVGEEAWIRINGSPWQHVFIGDCSGHSSTTRWMKRAGILAEIDYYLKEKWGVPDLRAAKGMITWQNPDPQRAPIPVERYVWSKKYPIN